MVNEKPMYREAFKNARSQKAAKALAMLGGEASYSEIERKSGVSGSTLVYHLNRLASMNIIEVPVKGTYRLKYRTPLCHIYDCKEVMTAYFGLLGFRENRTTPEPDVAIKLLTEQGYKPELVYVLTSPQALEEWRELKLPYQWIMCYEDEIIDIDAIKDKITPQLRDLLTKHTVILDCTSATKPATIAYYELSQQFQAPLIYVYEKTKKMKWLKSRETIKNQLGLDI